MSNDGLHRGQKAWNAHAVYTYGFSNKVSIVGECMRTYLSPAFEVWVIAKYFHAKRGRRAYHILGTKGKAASKEETSE